MEICKRDQCTGCFACVNICPKHCITMAEDEYGFIYPQIDEERCIHCDACKRVCLNHREISYHGTLHTYAAWARSSEDRQSSSSGGAASVFAQWVLDQGGVVFGAVWDGNNEACHACITKKRELGRLKGSKYVHSYINDTFTQCKRYLLKGNVVLFIGTPCQIEGLKGFLGYKEFTNLYLVDIVCHGVPSHKMLQQHLQRIIGEDENKVYQISFRANNQYKFIVRDSFKEIYRMKSSYDEYIRSFLEGAICRSNCYTCKFARPERVSDITLGDFWGIDKTLFGTEEEKGISCVLVHTEKGQHLLEQVKDKLELTERVTDEAVRGNGQLKRPVCRNEKREKILAQMRQGMHFDDAVQAVYEEELKAKRFGRLKLLRRKLDKAGRLAACFIHRNF